MTNIQNLIFNEIKKTIKIVLDKSIDIDTHLSSISWEPNNDCFNGDVFKGTIYLKNDNRIWYTFTGIMKSFNDFDIKKLKQVNMRNVVEKDLF